MFWITESIVKAIFSKNGYKHIYAWLTSRPNWNLTFLDPSERLWSMKNILDHNRIIIMEYMFMRTSYLNYTIVGMDFLSSNANIRNFKISSSAPDTLTFYHIINERLWCTYENSYCPILINTWNFEIPELVSIYSI